MMMIMITMKTTTSIHQFMEVPKSMHRNQLGTKNMMTVCGAELQHTRDGKSLDQVSGKLQVPRDRKVTSEGSSRKLVFIQNSKTFKNQVRVKVAKGVPLSARSVVDTSSNTSEVCEKCQYMNKIKQMINQLLKCEAISD